MTLSATLAAVLLSLVLPSPSGRWAPAYEQIPTIAEDIALAAEMQDPAPFAGPRARELLALAPASCSPSPPRPSRFTSRTSPAGSSPANTAAIAARP